MAYSQTDKTPTFSRGSQAKWIHVGFWVIVTIFFLCDRTYLIYKQGLPNFIACAAVRIMLLVGITYLNLYYFMPRFLMRGRYVIYFILVILSLICYLVLQSIYDLYLYGYILGPTKKEIAFSAISYNIFATIWYLILTVALKLSIDWYEQNKVLQEMRLQKLQAEVNYLRSQVNPHFLFNALNNLYALTLKKSDIAPSVVLKLSELMEYMLYESDEDFVPLEKEIKYLDNYLELEKIRQGNQAAITLRVTGKTDRCSIPPFLLLPLVENSFKHGISKAVHNAYLHIDIMVTEIGLEVSIANNKLNFHQAEQNGGIGLFNLKKRLELLYPGKHTLQITDQPDEFRVVIKIELPC